MVNEKLPKTTAEFETELIEIRHLFHQFPELSNEEFQTTASIRKLLLEADIEILDLPLKTGLVAQVSGNKDGPVIAIRCDIDALPIQEQTQLSYKSVNDGIMHACGHDFHTTAVLGSAFLLKQNEECLAGTVKIIFQPAEESGRGSLHILETGVLEEVEAIFGLHNSPSLPLGALGTRSGPFYAAVDRFEIEIKGAGAHAATPEKGTDPIVIAAQIVSSLQTIVSRNISAFDQALISVTQLTCGNTWNVIPETAYLQGTVRTLKAETRKLILDRIRQLSSGIATAFNASAEISFSDGPSAVYNDSKWTDFAFNVAEASGFITEEIPPELIGEDFSDYQKHIPGVFVNIGTGTPYPLHHPKFTVDDNILLKTAHYFAILAEAALHELTTG